MWFKTWLPILPCPLDDGWIVGRQVSAAQGKVQVALLRRLILGGENSQRRAFIIRVETLTREAVAIHRVELIAAPH